MIRDLQSILLAIFLGCLVAASLFRPAGAEEVDVQLVLAADVSLSMDATERRLQREAYIAAFRSQLVHGAIQNGPTGRIAVTYVEWAGDYDSDRRVIVPWTVIHDEATANAFASAIEAAPPFIGRRTAIGAALLWAASLFETSGHTSPRRVIDFSGDGSNNEGPPLSQSRDEVLARGIVINGLPLALDEPNPNAALNDNGVTLLTYYEACVMGGPGAFLIPVTAIEQLPDALKAKLILEIAGLASPPLVLPAIAEAGPVNCDGRYSF